MVTVRHLLDRKGRSIHSIEPEEPVLEGIRLMAEHHVGALLVMRGDELVGIVSERDYARQVVLKGKTSKDTPVRDIMTSNVFCVNPDRTMEECMAIMTERRCRHLPVLVEGEVTGILSIGDVVKAVISEKQFEIEQLTSYILKG